MMVSEMFKNVYQRGERILGRVVFQAKCTVIARYPTNDQYYGTAYLYTLFGDPALRLKYPIPTPVAEQGPFPLGPALRVFPNPVDGRTAVRYAPASTAQARIEVYDAAGARMAAADRGQRQAGECRTEIDCRDFAPGTYFVRVRAGTWAAVARLVKR